MLDYDVVSIHKSLFPEEFNDPIADNNDLYFVNVALDARKREEDADFNLRPKLLWSDFEAEVVDEEYASCSNCLDNILENQFVKMYSDQREVPSNRYPLSFETRVPKCVLKSLYYCPHYRYSIYFTVLHFVSLLLVFIGWCVYVSLVQIRSYVMLYLISMYPLKS